MAWRVFAAAAAGSSHLEAEVPCQDAFAHALAGETLIAAVCDGAGSQRLSHVGAPLVAHGVVDALKRVLDGRDPASIGDDAFAATVGDAIAGVRAALASRAIEDDAELAHYACTLVGAAVGPLGGHLFHVGDGLGIVRCADAAGEHIVSRPENGEYANETYFVTGERWREHLRIAPLAQPVDLIALMSDGAMPFVMAKGNAAFHAPFMTPVERFLAQATEADGNAALFGTLADPRTHRITSDDKTLLVALRR